MPAYELYFETGEAFAEDLSCNPHAFLTGSIIPAMHYGEERISLDEEICPTLRDGLLTVMGWFRHWYYRPDRKLVRMVKHGSALVLQEHLPVKGQAYSFPEA